MTLWSSPWPAHPATVFTDLASSRGFTACDTPVADLPCHRRRRSLIALAGVAAPWLGACSHLATEAEGRGHDAATGTALEPSAWQARLSQADVLLLGERHDNPHHHHTRGQWLAAMPGAIVVAEHLPRGARVRWAADGTVLAALEAAGFESKSWGWPVHQGLFTPLARSGQRLWGGNAPRDAVRRVAREGEAALPEALAASLRRAALTPEAQASLDADLLLGHCGQLPAARLPGMRWAQRARDAAMGQSLLDALDVGARPAVLVAGNGHVRQDWGVGQWLRAQRPGLRVLSVVMAEFSEADAAAPGLTQAGREATAADLLWLTPGVPGRGDPCAGLVMPR